MIHFYIILLIILPLEVLLDAYHWNCFTVQLIKFISFYVFICILPKKLSINIIIFIICKIAYQFSLIAKRINTKLWNKWKQLFYFLKTLNLFNRRISSDTKCLLSPASDVNLYVNVLFYLFSNYVVTVILPKNAHNAVNSKIYLLISNFDYLQKFFTDAEPESLNAETAVLKSIRTF